MEIVIINSIEDVKNYGELSVAHGFFDGVHKAHQALILNSVNYAKRNNLRSAVVTFDKKYVEGKTKLEYLQHLRLSTLARKTEIMISLGVEIMFILNFESFNNYSAKDYIDNVISPLGTKHFVMGKDNKFGHHGFGSFENIEQLAGDRFDVNIFDLVCEDCEKISTSIIKRKFASELIEEINSQLGYYYKLHGKVTKGNQIGRTIGFPTANMDVTDEMLIPRAGVYATLVKYNGNIYHSMTNIGFNPTVDFRNSLIVETHIFDFSFDIYNEQIDVYFIEKIREEHKFENLDKLIEQLAKDAECSKLIHENIDSKMII